MENQRLLAFSTTEVGELGLFVCLAIQDTRQWMETAIVIFQKTTKDAHLAWKQNQNFLFQQTEAGLAQLNEKVFVSNVQT